MTMFEPVPLDPTTWFKKIGQLRRRADSTVSEAPDRMIRMAFHLVRLAPGPMREVLPPPMGEDHLEELLSCGAYETAVLALMGPRCAFRAEKGFGESAIEVSVSMDERATPGAARHEICALAMLAAWAECLANLGKHSAGRAVNRRGPRISRGGSLPSSTEH